VRYDQKCTQVFTLTIRYPCQILIKLELSRQICEIFTNIKFHENPSSGSRVVPCGHEDGLSAGQADIRKLIVTFRTFAYALNQSVNVMLGK